MSSKYDSITTAANLVNEVMAHGLSTVQDDLNRAADIFGRSSIEELVNLANDIGRNNENGEPDPKGSWSSGRKATQSTFYMIASAIWNWEDVTRFWNLHTNPERKELAELKDLNARLGKENEKLAARRDELLEEVKQGADYTSKLIEQKMMAEARAEAAEAEIVKLKAKLYDMMMAGKEAK